jgi:mono/diheme cytochrome c family protein
MKWLKRIAISIGLLLALLLILIYGVSAYKLGHVYKVPVTQIEVPSDSASIAEGKRLASVFHCGGCHGKEMNGHVMLDDKFVGTLVAPNITSATQRYSVPQLEQIIRHGVKPDGTALWMPASSAFNRISDGDLGKVIAYLRTVKPTVSATEATNFFWLGARIGIIAGQFTPPADLIDHTAIRSERDSTAINIGKYYANTVCATCHGLDLKGLPNLGPSLVIAKSYSPVQFSTLLRTGTGITDRDLGLMKSVAQNHLKDFADDEVEAIYQYLMEMN